MLTSTNNTSSFLQGARQGLRILTLRGSRAARSSERDFIRTPGNTDPRDVEQPCGQDDVDDESEHRYGSEG